MRVIAVATQEESNNLSKITRMGIVYRFQTGKLKINHNWFLGYTKDENGELVIVPEQAETVRRIFREFLTGYSANKIAKGLTADGIINGAGRAIWWESTIRKILQNEKYMGDALLQKTYTVDYLSKQRAKNNGQMQKYYVENSHPAIITKDDFLAAQAEYSRRSNMRGYSKTGKSAFTSEYPFSGKIFCENCGSKFRRIHYGQGKNKKAYWICINRQTSGKDACHIKTVRESALEDAFVRAINKVISNKDTFIATLIENIKHGLSQVQPQYSIEDIERRLAELTQEMMSLVRLNAKSGAEVSTYDKEYAALAAEIEMLRERKQKIKNSVSERALFEERINELKEYLREQSSPLQTFDEDLFRKLIGKMTISSKNQVNFIIKCGIQLTEHLS